MRKTLIITALMASANAYAADLGLWEVKYKAETSYMDGYTVEGQAYEASGSFEKTGDYISSVRAVVSPESMSSGLVTRDRSIKEIIFTKSDETVPNIVFTFTRPCEPCVNAFKVHISPKKVNKMLCNFHCKYEVLDYEVLLVL